MTDKLTIAPELGRAVTAAIEAALPRIKAFRHARHQQPELTWCEEATAAAVARELRAIDGVHVQTGVGKLGVVGLIEGAHPGPTVALRADMDALPIQETSGLSYASKHDGVMHACGHDGHMATLLGAGMVLAKLRSELHGTVKLIFQPAEEGGAGGDAMCKDGALERPAVDVIFALHGWPEAPCGTIFLRSGPVMAATTHVRITVRGTGCHAAMPHLGTDQVLIAARIIEGLQSVVSRTMAPSEQVVLSITKINGGTANNILPATVVMEGTLRTLTKAARKRAGDAVARLVEGIAAAHGALADLELVDGYPPTINHEGPTAFLAAVAAAVLPAGTVQPMPNPSMGGEDFAYFLERVPGCYFLLGVDDGRQGGYPSLHHPAYDFNDLALPLGLQMFVHAALAYHATDSSLPGVR